MSRRYGIPPATALEQAQRTPRPSAAAFCPLPTATGQPPFRVGTTELEIPASGGSRVFHVIGDHGGVKDPNPQNHVAAALAADIPTSTSRPAPVSFMYSVGDVVYFNGDEQDYGDQFYEPYAHYTLPIVAIPGNHDGDNSDNTSVPSLSAFVENFCSPSPHLDPQADETNRDTMTQPNVYWTLQDDELTIVGLYTNVPSGGVVKPDQAAWFVGELKDAPTDRALIVAMHHPAYSCDAMHGGSATMGSMLDASFQQAGRYPDLIIAGHVHNYQRFTRKPAQRQIPYIVCGAGGYHNLHAMAPGAANGLQVTSDTTLEAFCANEWGFLRITAGAGRLVGEYVAVDKTGTVKPAMDSFAVDLQTHVVS